MINYLDLKLCLSQQWFSMEYIITRVHQCISGCPHNFSVKLQKSSNETADIVCQEAVPQWWHQQLLLPSGTRSRPPPDAIDGNGDLDGAFKPPWLSGGPLRRMRQHFLLHESDAGDEHLCREPDDVDQQRHRA